MTSPLDQEKIPFVFLPLSSGQVVYPSARIRISDGDDSDLAISPSSSSYISENLENVSPGEESKANLNDDEPICVVSSTDLMYRDGWNNLEKIYNSLSSSSLLPSSGKNDANSKTSDNFYHHPLRLVQHPNAKTSLQVNSNHTIFIDIFSYIIASRFPKNNNKIRTIKYRRMIMVFTSYQNDKCFIINMGGVK